MDKTNIRKTIYKKRCTLGEMYVKKNSAEIFKNLKTTQILGYNNILVYSDFKNEVQTGEIIDYLFKNNKKVYLPVCDCEKLTFSIHEISVSDFDSQLNFYGIKEPKFSKPSNNKIDCVIIPGIAFDTAGNRIGFGKGYYDKFLSENYSVCKIALCYEFQIVEKIPANPHDVPVDLIITEDRVIKTR